MFQLQKFPSIELFNRLYARETWEGLPVRRTLRLRGKPKLHGKNGGIRHQWHNGQIFTRAQGKSEDLTSDTAHKTTRPFALAVEDAAQRLGHLAAVWLRTHGLEGTTMTVYGEWGGKGVQKGQEALAKVDTKTFYPFAVMIGEPSQDEHGNRTGAILITDVAEISEIVQGYDQLLGFPVIPIPFEGDVIEFNFTSDAALQAALDRVNAMVESTAALDPFIKAIHNVEGPGEGYVFMPVASLDDAVPYEVFERISFKAKTKAHAGRHQPRPATPKPETPASVLDLVGQFCTEARFQQGVEEACEGSLDRKRTGAFLNWMKGDVHKEAAPEIAELGVEISMIDAEIAKASRTWFLERC